MNHDAKVWLNGNLSPWREATVPILSHGFSRGSAIFEVLGTHLGPQGTMAFRMDAHLKRLLKSAELLGMEHEALITRMQESGGGGRTLSAMATAADHELLELPERLGPDETLETRMLRTEAALVRTALDDEGWDPAAAAQVLGIGDDALAEAMRRHGLRAPGSGR